MYNFIINNFFESSKFNKKKDQIIYRKVITHHGI